MTRDEILAIAKEGDPRTMREALRQLADMMREGDPVFRRVVNATGLSQLRARLLALLWRSKGEVIYWDRLTVQMGYDEPRSLQEGVLRHLRKQIAAHPEWGVRLDTVPLHGPRLVATGPVPWDTGDS